MENTTDHSFPRSARPGPGIWLWNKPAGLSSFTPVKEANDALAAVPGKRWPVCHAGALDPFATGLLPILIGPATRLFERLHALPKTYDATLTWGTQTTSDDGGGEVLHRSDKRPTQADVEGQLARLKGWADQRPPNASNKRVDGERAYVKAQRGEAVSLPAQPAYLHEAQVLEHSGDTTRVRLVVRGGFYVRSLARDVGEALGCFGHVSALERTQIGPWKAPALGLATKLSAADTVPFYRRVVLNDAEWGAVRKAADSTLVSEARRVERAEDVARATDITHRGAPGPVGGLAR